MGQYNKLNNILGWLVFAISLVTYTLTLEGTASFWDCGEFISSAYKLEVGHPPGNPIFMLTARFFANFAGDPSQVAWMVNFMSGVLSAATILLLFWTITHLAKKIIAKSSSSISKWEMITVLGSGLVGSLAYAFSDTFWYSAVEGEVYAYSSFCTALVFWLILKWEAHADEKHSYRYIILIAYIIGISIAVHLLNLLCIPAIVLVYYYKKFNNVSAKGSLWALVVSFVIIFFILYGLVPGFIKVAGWMELLFVNVFSAPFNSGALFYFILVIACMSWGIYETFKQNNITRLRVSFLVSLIMVGIPFISDSIWISVIISLAFAFYILVKKSINVRLINMILTSILVIFIGYSSYALILIRSSANPPMDQNAPNDVFKLSSYLNREQYGDRPLFFGYTFASEIERDSNGDAVSSKGAAIWRKGVKTAENSDDRYVISDYKRDYSYNSELNMLFPRMYSSIPGHVAAYKEWSGFKGKSVVVNSSGSRKTVKQPTFAENLKYFLNYQVNYMYWRYFMWNFAGRQNDLQGNGEITNGNWITGFNFIDNLLVGNQELLPSDLANNKGRNVYYMLPLLLGLAGLFFQAYSGQKGIESFWVTFFLFFMTGLAIVIYLNQTPGQPRERDYAYAGSFYAFAIWIGLGVCALQKGMHKYLFKNDRKLAAIVASVLALFIPIQMVSQTWDDHDRSGRTVARDFAKNYLSSVEENGIIFTNGDNDTFPLWYVQETEGFRTDVRVCNLSYLQTDWYVDQMKSEAYESAPLPIDIPQSRYGNNKLAYAYVYDRYNTALPLSSALDFLISDDERTKYIPEFRGNYDHIPSGVLYINTADVDTTIVPKKLMEYKVDTFKVDIAHKGTLMLNEISVLSILNSVAKDNWKRPVYYSVTVGPDMYVNLQDNFVRTGLAYQILPVKKANRDDDSLIDTDKMYDNMMNKFVFGGIENPDIYLDENIKRMVFTIRMQFIDLATALINENDEERAKNVLDYMMEKIPSSACTHDYISIQPAMLYYSIGETEKGKALMDEIANNSLEYLNWFSTLNVNQLNSVQREYQRHDYTIRTILSFFYNVGDVESADRYIEMLEGMGYEIS